MSAQSPNRIVKSVDLEAPIERVWLALTDHKEFGKWFRVQLDGPFELGVETTGRMTVPGHEGVEWISLTEQISHPHIFAFSWPPSAVDPDGTYTSDAKILVEFRLEEMDNHTRLTITESGFEQFRDSIRLEVLRSNKQGWEIQAENVSKYVAG